MSIAVGNLNDLINVATNSKAIVSNLACVTNCIPVFFVPQSGQFSLKYRHILISFPCIGHGMLRPLYETPFCASICSTTLGPCNRLFSMKMSLLTLPAVMTPMM